MGSADHTNRRNRELAELLMLRKWQRGSEVAAGIGSLRVLLFAFRIVKSTDQSRFRPVYEQPPSTD